MKDTDVGSARGKLLIDKFLKQHKHTHKKGRTSKNVASLRMCRRNFDDVIDLSCSTIIASASFPGPHILKAGVETLERDCV